jgi:hypothetical protein
MDGEERRKVNGIFLQHGESLEQGWVPGFFCPKNHTGNL